MSDETKPPPSQLAAALCKVQGQLESAKKDAKNPHFGTKYADLASIYEVIRGPLAEAGIAVIQVPSTVPDGVRITTTLLHVSGESVSGDLVLPVEKKSPQGVGSAITYGRRYALAAMIGVAAEDDDGNEAEKNQPKPQPQTQQRPRAAPREVDAKRVDEPKPKALPATSTTPGQYFKPDGAWVGGGVSRLSKEQLAVAISEGEGLSIKLAEDPANTGPLASVRGWLNKLHGQRAPKGGHLDGYGPTERDS